MRAEIERITVYENLVALFVSVIIFRFGIMTAKDSILILMDAWLDKDSINRIRQEIGDIQGVNLVEDIKLRKSGLVVFGEVAVEIEGEANLKRVEMLSEEIEKTVKKEVRNLEHVVINVKPAKMEVIKIAFPVETRNGLLSTISWHFGKAPYYIFIEQKEGKTTNWEIIENPAAGLDKKRGDKKAYFLKLFSCEVFTTIGGILTYPYIYGIKSNSNQYKYSS